MMVWVYVRPKIVSYLMVWVYVLSTVIASSAACRGYVHLVFDV